MRHSGNFIWASLSYIPVQAGCEMHAIANATYSHYYKSKGLCLSLRLCHDVMRPQHSASRMLPDILSLRLHVKAAKLQVIAEARAFQHGFDPLSLALLGPRPHQRSQQNRSPRTTQQTACELLRTSFSRKGVFQPCTLWMIG